MRLFVFQLRKYKRFFQLSFKRSLKSKVSTHSLAMGAAVGVFFGLGPTFGFQLVPALLVCVKLGYNKLLALLMVFISNPLTVVPIYLFNAWVGRLVFSRFFSIKNSHSIEAVIKDFSWQGLFSLGGEMVVVFWLGCLLVSFVSAVVVYLLFYYVISAWRRRRLSPVS